MKRSEQDKTDRAVMAIVWCTIGWLGGWRVAAALCVYQVLAVVVRWRRRRVIADIIEVLRAVGRPMSSFEISTALGWGALRSGSIFPHLIQLEDAHVIVSFWDEPDPQAPLRPRRRRYELVSSAVS